MPDKNRAKQIITEIIRLHAGELPTKTSLFKAFYFAHLYYAKSASGYLSDWPIVRMPNGPGIDNADSLLEEMVDEGILDLRIARVGPYAAMKYSLKKNAVPAELSIEEIDAIKSAVDFVKGKSATELSAITHEYSRSWQMGQNGDELNIYVDLEPGDRFAQRMQAFDRLDGIIADVWSVGQN
jgi:hypothetical protein